MGRANGASEELMKQEKIRCVRAREEHEHIRQNKMRVLNPTPMKRENGWSSVVRGHDPVHQRKFLGVNPCVPETSTRRNTKCSERKTSLITYNCGG